MSNAVLISIRPRWCEMIASGQKTLEVRKTRPKLEPPFKCYIYMTRFAWAFDLLEQYGMDDLAERLRVSTGKVIGEFVCNKVHRYVICGSNQYDKRYCEVDPSLYIHPIDYKPMCLSEEEFISYGNGAELFGLHISDLVIYDKPKGLGEFRSWNTGVVFKDGYPMPTHEIKRPPQSWCYVEELKWTK